jgi:hypothetical protein
LREELNPALRYDGEPLRNERFGNPTPIQTVPKKDDPLARVLLREDIPLQRAPRLIKELPYDQRQMLLRNRRMMLEGIGHLPSSTEMAKGIKDPVVRGVVRENIRKDFESEAEKVKREWAKDAGGLAEAHRMATK